MVILKLLPEAISRHWEVISHALLACTMSGYEPDDNYLTRMAAKLISGNVQCWGIHRTENNQIRLAAFGFTSIITDGITDERNLLILGMYVLGRSEFKEWLQGLDAFKKFAKGNDCKNIVFYTNVPHLIELAKKVGGVTAYTYGIVSVT